ncbi:MAG TPA: hypothetical protein VHQ41_00215 [Patescibacteria group bacterium]|nr:hypothetical protein [Patescibacteria group bacterium]
MKIYWLLILVCFIFAVSVFSQKIPPQPPAGYIIAHTPNKDVVHLHFNRQIGYRRVEWFSGGKYTYRGFDGPTIAGQPTALFESMGSVEGVVEASMDQYNISIQKAPAFEWSYILAKVVALVGDSVTPRTKFVEIKPTSSPAKVSLYDMTILEPCDYQDKDASGHSVLIQPLCFSGIY